jgi:16S rRNA (adenine1518-N6/adenine1519-N6)-dimethyltransferase
VILEQRGQPLFTDVDTKAFFLIIKAGFAQKRKTLLNSLSSGLHVPKDLVVAACEKAGIEPIRRAQTLSLDEWHDLYHALNT